MDIRSGNRSDHRQKDSPLKRLSRTLIQQLYSLDSEILSKLIKKSTANGIEIVVNGKECSNTIEKDCRV